jgi:hypothetical protein
MKLKMAMGTAARTARSMVDPGVAACRGTIADLQLEPVQ